MSHEPKDMEAALRRSFTRRLFLAGGAQAALFGLLGQRLYQLQVLEASELAALAESNRTATHLIAPERGAILDRFGKALATNRLDMRVSIIPGLTKNVDATLAALGRIVSIDPDIRQRALRLARRQSPHLPIVVAAGLSWRQFALINILAPQLPGVMPDQNASRVYHEAASSAHVVGYVGAAGKSRIHEDPVMRLPGFRVGMAGIEQGFDRELRGEAGQSRIEVDAHGRRVRGLGQTKSAHGGSLVLTIDREMQHMAAKRIAGERKASVVALDVRSGDIILMASTPSFDPNDLVRDITPDSWSKLSKNKDHPLSNKAIQGQYPPGSTFKMVTALAGLEAGVINTRTRIHCGGGFNLGRAHFGCWKRQGHGSLSVRDAIKQSCDVFFYETAHRLGVERLGAMTRRLGIGAAFDIGLSEEKPGLVPDAGWKRATLGLPWYGGETVIAGIGQGFVLSTVLQLAVMTARLATGLAIRPRIAFSQGITPSPAPLGVKPGFIDVIRDGMDAVVNEPGGTAGRSKLEIEGVRMAGKTGTSQVTRLSVGRHFTSMPYHLRDHALFVGYAPADAPRYAVACVVEHGGGGSRAAAPIVKDVMTALIQRDPLSMPAHPAATPPPDVSASAPQENI